MFTWQSGIPIGGIDVPIVWLVSVDVPQRPSSMDAGAGERCAIGVQKTTGHESEIYAL